MNMPAEFPQRDAADQALVDGVLKHQLRPLVQPPDLRTRPDERVQSPRLLARGRG
ncbi:MAG: hypothetical protein HGA75_17925 [Thiobacillus sp.]|nr:hypothetical protein [Thiobacillus sp.]